jgi:hypothetical protein
VPSSDCNIQKNRRALRASFSTPVARLFHQTRREKTAGKKGQETPPTLRPLANSATRESKSRGEGKRRWLCRTRLPQNGGSNRSLSALLAACWWWPLLILTLLSAFPFSQRSLRVRWTDCDKRNVSG